MKTFEDGVNLALKAIALLKEDCTSRPTNSGTKMQKMTSKETCSYAVKYIEYALKESNK